MDGILSDEWGSRPLAPLLGFDHFALNDGSRYVLRPVLLGEALGCGGSATHEQAVGAAAADDKPDKARNRGCKDEDGNGIIDQAKPDPARMGVLHELQNDNCGHDGPEQPAA